MKKISEFKIFEKFRSLDQETRNIYFYGALFVFIILTALIIKLIPNKELTVSCSNKEDIINELTYQETLENISNNYEENIIINKYYINEYINIKKELDKEIVNVKKNNINETIYNLNNKEEILNDIDITFIKPENILELIYIGTHDNNKYIINTDSWINIYNKINNTELSKKIDGQITIEFTSYKDNNLSLLIDLTNLYNNLDYNYEKVNYNIEFKNINKIVLEKTSSFVETNENIN
jgi:hypothetical protein